MSNGEAPQPMGNKDDSRSAADRHRLGRSLDELCATTSSTKVILRGGPKDLDFAACPFPVTPVQEKMQEWQIDVPWPDEADAPWELLKWFAEVLQRSGVADEARTQKQNMHMALPPSLSKESRAWWHKTVEGFREPVSLTANSEGVGSSRYLQIMPDTGRGGGHKGKSKAVSEQAKELWKWCQEEGGASWSYSQGEIEDLLQGKEPLPPVLQQLMNARSVGLQLVECIKKKQEAEALELIDREHRSVYMRDANRHGYAIHHAVYENLEHVVARLAIMPGVVDQKDSHRQTPEQLAKMLKRQDVLDILKWARS